MLSDLCLSVCPVFNVGVLWPNGWMDQGKTWHSGRPQPRPQSVRWGPNSYSQKGTQSPNFRPNVCCGQTAGWIKMPLGMEIELGPGDIVLDGDPAPPPHKKGHSSPQLSAHVDCGQTPGCSKMPHCVRWRTTLPQKGTITPPQF